MHKKTWFWLALALALVGVALAIPAAIAALRVVYQGNGVTRYFNVQNARNLDERNRTIELLVSEGLNEG